MTALLSLRQRKRHRFWLAKAGRSKMETRTMLSRSRGMSIGCTTPNVYLECHRHLPNSAQTRRIARERCDLTVPSCRPVASAIWLTSNSSIKRSKNTVRCRSFMPLTASHTRLTCSRAKTCCSSETSRLDSYIQKGGLEHHARCVQDVHDVLVCRGKNLTEQYECMDHSLCFKKGCRNPRLC